MYDNSKEAYDTRMEDAFNLLKRDGFEVYFPDHHKGKCIRPYVVVKGAGETKVPFISSTTSTIELLCYVPVDRSSTLEKYCESVKQTMKELYPLIRPLHNDIGDFIDDEIKANMRTLQYEYYRKIER